MRLTWGNRPRAAFVGASRTCAFSSFAMAQRPEEHARMLSTDARRLAPVLLHAPAAGIARRRKSGGTVTASGRVYLWQSGSLWIGHGQGRSEWHQHHAHQLALALDGEFR